MGKFRITPAVRLSIGLVILTLSILILAQALGLAPGTERQQLNVRQSLAETLAVQTIMAIKRGDMLLLQAMLENHAKEGLPAADIQVIRRGKALEYFSRHYGKVYVDEGRTISVTLMNLVERHAPSDRAAAQENR